MTTVNSGQHEAVKPQAIKAVIFDIGETLLDDTRELGKWAEWLGVRPNTMSAMLGAMAATGRDYAEIYQLFMPGFNGPVEYNKRAAVGKGQQIDDSDLYDDVRPALKALQDMGLFVGVAGNQLPHVGGLLKALDLPAHQIATSDEWRAAKPDPEFFDRVAEMAPCERSEILYVGDNVDNDVHGAHKAGMKAALVRRGPWGWLAFQDPEQVKQADWAVHSLLELPELIAESRKAQDSLASVES